MRNMSNQVDAILESRDRGEVRGVGVVEWSLSFESCAFGIVCFACFANPVLSWQDRTRSVAGDICQTRKCSSRCSWLEILQHVMRRYWEHDWMTAGQLGSLQREQRTEESSFFTLFVIYVLSSEFLVSLMSLFFLALYLCAKKRWRPQKPRGAWNRNNTVLVARDFLKLTLNSSSFGEMSDWENVLFDIFAVF